MTLKRTGIFAAALAIVGLGGCNKSEPVQDVSEDQLNHYAGIETHDHPVDNAGAAPVGNEAAPVNDSGQR